MKVGFISLGCAKNQVNCEQMIWKTYEAGYEVALGAEDCDVAVVNTCGFLQEAREEALAEIDALPRPRPRASCKRSWSPAAWPVVEGRDPGPLSPGRRLCGGQWVRGHCPSHRPGPGGPAPRPLRRHRRPRAGDRRVVCTSDYWAWLRIAEGCDNRCAYCIIPFIRGKFRSRPEEAILAEAQDLAQAGMQELIVVAQDITRYGLDLYGARTLPNSCPSSAPSRGSTGSASTTSTPTRSPTSSLTSSPTSRRS